MKQIYPDLDDDYIYEKLKKQQYNYKNTKILLSQLNDPNNQNNPKPIIRVSPQNMKNI